MLPAGASVLELGCGTGRITRQLVRLGYRVTVTSAATVRADGLRASRGGIGAVFKSRVLRIHLVDAMKYELARLVAPIRRRHLRPIVRIASSPQEA